MRQHLTSRKPIKCQVSNKYKVFTYKSYIDTHRNKIYYSEIFAQTEIETHDIQTKIVAEKNSFSQNICYKF